MPTAIDTPMLVAEREQLRRQLAEIGDLRPGSLVVDYRKCGKPNCHCAAEGGALCGTPEQDVRNRASPTLPPSHWRAR